MIINVGVIGLGIIGGSLVKAIAKKGLSGYVVAYDLNGEAVETAWQEGTVHLVADESYKAFRGCEIIFICVPVDKIPSSIRKLSTIVNQNCILTDVGSTKTNVLSAISKMPLDCPFIGGHPMAGSEACGYRAARANLFENAYYVLTPTRHCSPSHVERLSQFIGALGALPVVMEADKHDYATAAISHVPHVLASALVSTIKQLDDQDNIMHMLAAGGFKDITRIASSSPGIWESICLTNRENIIYILDELEKNIDLFKGVLSRNEEKALNSFFCNAKEYRDSFSDKRIGALLRTYDIVVDVEDRPGVIAHIASLLGNHDINIKNIGINNSREMEGGAMEICFYDQDSQQASHRILKGMGYTVICR